jgi:hypothetical protein
LTRVILPVVRALNVGSDPPIGCGYAVLAVRETRSGTYATT